METPETITHCPFCGEEVDTEEEIIGGDRYECSTHGKFYMEVYNNDWHRE